MTMLLVKQIIGNNKWSSHSYVISDITKSAFIIDPGECSDLILTHIVDAGLDAKAILLTHGHFDHIGTVAVLKEKLQIPLIMHRSDSKMLKHSNLYRHSFIGESPVEIPVVDEYFSDKGVFSIGLFSLEVIETPGHTPGSVCLRIENYLFSGDTLMRGNIGRTDLPGGNRDNLIKSLSLLSELPLSTIVCPGHGLLTNMADEIQNNVALREVLYGD
jgi:glyoxylase-like metal-dependent hydrolase (beta-lactamase superfamily II)